MPMICYRRSPFQWNSIVGFFSWSPWGKFKHCDKYSVIWIWLMAIAHLENNFSHNQRKGWDVQINIQSTFYSPPEPYRHFFWWKNRELVKMNRYLKILFSNRFAARKINWSREKDEIMLKKAKRGREKTANKTCLKFRFSPFVRVVSSIWACFLFSMAMLCTRVLNLVNKMLVTIVPITKSISSSRR